MEDKPKSSKLMFYIGIVFIIVAAILLLGNLIGESTFPTILWGMLGTIGLLFIAATKFPSLLRPGGPGL